MNIRKENFCHLLNVTYAILGYTSKINYRKIECNYQSRDLFCYNINELFANIHVIPNPVYVKIVNLLELSLMNTLECSNKPSNIDILSFKYELFIILGMIISIVSIILFVFLYKVKKY